MKYNNLYILLLYCLLYKYPTYTMDTFESKKEIHHVDNNIKQCIQAIKSDDAQTLEVLIKNKICDLHYKDAKGNTYLLWAIKYNAKESICVLLKNGADPSITNNNHISPLIYAINKTDLNLVKKLITYKATINPTTKPCIVPLIHAIEKTDKYDISTNSDTLKDIITTLIAYKADVNQYDYRKMFALQIATIKSNESIVRYLLESKADVSQKDINDNTCLSLAAESDDRPIIYLLEEYERLSQKPCPLAASRKPRYTLTERRPSTIITEDPCKTPTESDALIQKNSNHLASPNSKSAITHKSRHCHTQ